jgi:peptidoglycan/LPS O-acetylase OafA/YrhL
MLQRKQTIWLLISMLSIVLCNYIPFAHNTRISRIPPINMLTIDMNTTYNIITKIAAISILVIILITVFIYKNRGVQKLLSIICTILCVLFTIYMVYIGNDKSSNSTLYFGVVLPLIAALFCTLAFFGIHKDDKLIKSADRLR